MRRRAVSSKAPWIASLALAAGCVSLTPYEELVADLPPERLLQIHGNAVYVEDRGAGEAVVLVHGFGSSSYGWRHVSEELARDFRVVALDLAGFGFTERPREKASYSRYAQGERVLAVMDRLGVERAHLVGHSYGGSVAMALAVRSPTRFLSLALVDSAALDYPQARRTPAAALRPLTSLMVRTRSLRRDNVEAKLKRSAADDSVVTDEVVDEYWRRLRVEGAPRAFWGLTAPLRDPQEPFGLADIGLPTLVVWGARDELITVDSARRSTARIPTSRFVVIEDAGHVPMEDRPLELVAHLRTFFGHGLAAFE